MLVMGQLSGRDVQCDRSEGSSYVLFGVVPSLAVASAIVYFGGAVISEFKPRLDLRVRRKCCSSE